MLTLIALMSAAYATDLSVKMETGLDFPLTAPQAQMFETGATQGIGVLFPISPAFDLGPVGSVQVFPSEDGSAHAVAWGLGATGRVKPPRDAETKFSPWADADILFGLTDDLSRPSFAVGTGVAVPTDKQRSVWVGPFVRYGHVFQENRDTVNFDNTDARLLSAGISLEVGKRLAKDLTQTTINLTIQPMPVPECSTQTLSEVSEVVYFDFNKSDITPENAAKIDALIAGEKGQFLVIARGHTDSVGSYEYNQGLSNRRVQAVVDYLSSKGVSATQITPDGYSESLPIDTNDTATGRANNRRVEIFVITQTEVK